MATWEKERMLHFQNVRTNPVYRLYERLADLEAAQEPCHFIEPLPVGNIGINNNINNTLYIYKGENQENLHQLLQRIDHLQGELRFLERNLNSHVDKSIKKAKESQPKYEF